MLVILTGLSVGQARSRPYTPALFDVQNVASDDVLNVRKDPDAASEIIGILAHDTKAVEVVTLSGFGFDMLVVEGKKRRFVSGCCSLSERGHY